MGLFALLAAATIATAPLPPSAAALEIASALVSVQGFGGAQMSPAFIAESLNGQLLGTTRQRFAVPCDSAVPACRAAAQAISQRYAQIYVTAFRAATVEVHAMLLDKELGADKLAATRQFFATAAGKSFSETWRKTVPVEQQGVSRQLDEVQRRVDAAWSRQAMYDEFDTATKGLPRSTRPAPVTPVFTPHPSANPPMAAPPKPQP